MAFDALFALVYFCGVFEYSGGYAKLIIYGRKKSEMAYMGVAVFGDFTGSGSGGGLKSAMAV